MANIERVYHGLFKGLDGKKSRLYGIWENMRFRCGNINSKRYKNYGGRGITVYPEWAKDFSSFHTWSHSNGYDIGLTIDRIDVNGNYEPSNCRWTTQKVQGNNRRNNVRITFNGQTKTVAEWADFTGNGYHVIKNRLKRGWPIEQALNPTLLGPGKKREGMANGGKFKAVVSVNGQDITVMSLAKSMGIEYRTLTQNISKMGAEKALAKKYVTRRKDGM